MRTNKEFIHNKFSFTKSGWHGTSTDFSRNYSATHENSQINKLAIDKKLESLHKKILLDQQQKISSQISLCRQLSAKLDHVSSKVRDVNVIIKDKEVEDYIMNNAALTIQRFVRGHLTKKHMEARIIHKKFEKEVKKIDDMIAEREFFIYNVGRMPDISARVIQRAYKRHVFRMKIERLSNAYLLYMLKKEEANYRDLKNKIRLMTCGWIVKTVKFETRKQRRLKAIREKWAISVIQKAFRKNHWKGREIIEKIKRYKRRARAILKKKTIKRKSLIEQYTGDLKDIENNKDFDLENISIESCEDFETTTSDREALERERLLAQLLEERKRRIHLGKISYNYKELRLPKLVTLLNQHEVLATIDESSVFLQRTQDKPVLKKKQRRYVSKNDSDEPSYMKSTQSFSMGQEIHSISPRLKKYTNYAKVNLTNIVQPTLSYLLKIQKRSLSIDKSTLPLSPQARAEIKPIPIQKKSLRPPEFASKASDKTLTPSLPEIASHPPHLPIHVKPRVNIMKNFARIRAIPYYNFS